MKHKHLVLLVLIVGLSGFLAGQNGALRFNASAPNDDYVSFGTNQFNQLFSGLSGYSFEGWIYANSLATGTSRNRIINIQISSGAVSLFVGLTDSGKLEIGARSGSGDSYQVAISSSSVISTGQWYHIAAVVNFATGSKSIRGYVNGTQVVANTNPTFANTTFVPGVGAAEILGLHPSNLPLFSDQFIGTMDEFRIWNHPRTATQIAADVYKKLTGSETGVIGLWDFDETSGTTADDSSSSNKNGTLVNFPANPWVNGAPNLSPVPTSQSTNIIATNIGATNLTLSWNNGNGAKRVVVMNTVNSFTDPINGSDPTANTVWQDAGQQVIYNGTGNSVPVTGLAETTAYWFRVYEYNGSGVYTIYNTSTAVNNPVEGDETLPIELSTFTATFTINNLVVLHWVTQSETNCQGYYVYRSRENDIATAQLLNQLIPANNTSEQQTYSFNDTEIYESGTYYYWLQSLDFDGSHAFHGPITVNVFQGGENPPPDVPLVSGLRKLFPNPFSAHTVISYAVKEQSPVAMQIYNTRGQLVRSFTLGSKDQGEFSLIWNGKNESGADCPSGIYIVRMTAGKTISNARLMLVK